MDAPRLDDLIELARATAASKDPIDELEAAATLKSDLDELTDALLGHFVDQARRAGRSWTQIGAALGVTKQAAQQRHTSTESTARRLLAQFAPRFMTRFTPRARSVVVGAQETCRRLGHTAILPEHLLLALYAEPEGIAARVLLASGVTHDIVERAVLAEHPAGDVTPSGHIRFTRDAKKALELTLSAALELGHNYIGTEHLLLALLKQGGGAAALLRAQGVTLDGARADIVRLLTTG